MPRFCLSFRTVWWWFQSYGHFTEWVDFANWWNCISLGSEHGRTACITAFALFFEQNKMVNMRKRRTSYFSLLESIPAKYSLIYTISAHSRLFQPILAFSSLFQPISSYSSLFKTIQANSSLVLPTPVYSSQLKPILA